MDDKYLDKSDTKKKLIENGKEEFLKKGYLGASLRNICKVSGVTTGAFYFSFSSKEELFQSILAPVVEEWNILVSILAEREKNSPESAVDNDQAIMKFQFEHKEEALILMEGAVGSCYESFKDEMFQRIEDLFMEFFQNAIGHRPQKELIQILVNMRIQGNMMILKGDYDMTHILELSKIVGCYAEGGFEKLVSEMKDVL